MSGMSPWGERFTEMVKTAPVEKEFAIATLSGLVPPGQAWRTYEKTLRRNWEKNGRPIKAEAVVPHDDGLRSGARQIVMATIVGMVARGRIRQETDAWGRVTYHFLSDPKPNPTGEAARQRALKGLETTRQRYGDDFFSQRSKKMAEARTPEERSASAMKGWLNKTPEQRADIIRRGLEAQPPELRSKSIREGWKRRSREERERMAKDRWATISAEERHRRAMKGVETRRRRGWFREGSQGPNDTVPNGTERGAEPDQPE